MSERLRVMVVDDEPLARQGLRLLLAADPDVEVVGECSGFWPVSSPICACASQALRILHHVRV